MQIVKGALAGILGFGGSVLLTSLFLSQEMLPLVIAALVGSFILLIVLGFRQNLIKNTFLSMIALVVAFLVGFGLGEVSTLIPLEGEGANIVFFIIAPTIYTLILGVILYGKHAIGFFAGVGLILSILFTLVIFVGGLLKGVFWNGIDLNLVLILATLGGVAGITLGAYQMKKGK